MRNRRLLTLLLAVLVLSVLVGCSERSRVAQMEEQNKAMVQRIHAEVSKGNIGIFDEVLSPDYVRHCQAMPPESQELHGTDQFKAFIVDFLTAVPDCNDSVLFVIAENDMVAYVTKMTGNKPVQWANCRPVAKNLHLLTS